MWKYQQKEQKKYKGKLLTWRITCSFARFSSSRYVLLHCNEKTISCDVKETMASRYRCWLCIWINKKRVCNKRGSWKSSQKLINRECWMRLGRVAKNRIINKRGFPSIRNSRVDAAVFSRLFLHFSWLFLNTSMFEHVLAR